MPPGTSTASRRASNSALTYLRQATPDIVCLQEIKSVDEGFPGSQFEDLGYNVAVHGQKGFNGVAILSKLPLDDVQKGLRGGHGDDQSRFIEATVSVPAGVIKVASIYAPNGNPIGTEKFSYKLAWLKRLEAHARALLADEVPAVLAGDYNIIPEPEDARRPEAWTTDALFQPESRAAYRCLLNDGLTDAVRLCHPDAGRLHVLGLSGRRLPEGRRHPHRPPAALAASRRPARIGRHRPLHARLGEAVGPRSRLGRSRPVRTDLLAAVHVDDGARRRQEPLAADRLGRALIERHVGGVDAQAP